MKTKTHAFFTLMVMLLVGMVYAQQQQTTPAPASQGLADQLKPARATVHRVASTSPSTATQTPAGQEPSPDFRPPQVLHRVDPIYPEGARSRRIWGTLVVAAEVDKVGNVGKVRFMSGPPIFKDAAIDAVKLWKFKPATFHGQPLQTTTSITLDFCDGPNGRATGCKGTTR